MEEAYVERLSVPFRWWALAVMFWATVLVAFLVAVPTVVAVGVVAVLMTATAAFLVTWGSAQVSVADGTFHAGRARIPARLLADAEPLDAQAARRAVGVDADARAYLLLRPYVPTAVRVRVVDPQDPTPYWVVASRHPDALAACLQQACLNAAPRGRVVSAPEDVEGSAAPRASEDDVTRIAGSTERPTEKRR